MRELVRLEAKISRQIRGCFWKFWAFLEALRTTRIVKFENVLKILLMCLKTPSYVWWIATWKCYRSSVYIVAIDDHEFFSPNFANVNEITERHMQSCCATSTPKSCKGYLYTIQWRMCKHNTIALDGGGGILVWPQRKASTIFLFIVHNELVTYSW